VVGWKRKRHVPELRILWLNARGDENREFRVLKWEVAFGSGEDNQFVIQRPSISRHHASLAFRKGHYEISDLGSTNGTFVNGRRVRNPTILEIGDEIRIGDATFIIAKPADSGVLPSAGKHNLPKKILTARGTFEAVMLAFAIGFCAAQYLAYLLYHEQNRLILAEAVPINLPGNVPVPQPAPNHHAELPTSPRTEGTPAAAPKIIARAVVPTRPKVSNVETIAAKELAGGIALVGLIAGSGTRAGHPAPDFALPQLEGTDVSLATMHGKVVLLNFWATWCGACRSEMPSLEKLYRNFHSYRDFAVLTVNIDQRGKPAVAQFITTSRYDFPVLLDASNATSIAYGVSGIPSTFVIGRDGQIIWNCVGALDWSNPAIRDALRKLL
jgi:peroxiredoxin